MMFKHLTDNELLRLAVSYKKLPWADDEMLKWHLAWVSAPLNMVIMRVIEWFKARLLLVFLPPLKDDNNETP